MGLMRLTVTRRPSTHTMVAAVSTRPTLTSSFACHNNSSRTSYTMSESEIRSQTRHKYPTCIRACVIVHMRLQQSQHGPLRASRRLRGTSVRDTVQEPRSTHLCATHASAHDGATNASKAHLGPRTRGVNILQPVTPHSTPPRRAECLPLPSRSSRSRQSSIMLVRKEDPMQEGFVRKEDPSCSQAGGGFRRKEDRMHEGVSSGPHAGEGFVRTACKRRVSSPSSMIPIVAP